MKGKHQKQLFNVLAKPYEQVYITAAIDTKLANYYWLMLLYCLKNQKY